ncbi:MAG: aldo/keto reductase [Anaerolineaceae bacterium]|nr:aldo/keto reductase [Anaerolineaceae bacterium]
MKYRPFGKTSLQISALGFGCMRLPVINDDSAQIDRAEAIRMLRYAIDCGLNYVDTAWTYHAETSEILVGEALKDGYRQKAYLATKLPSWEIHSQDDMERFLTEQLKKLQTDHIDFYLLHALNINHWENYLRLKVFDWAEKKRQEGLIRHLGFSFHDRYQAFETILNGYDAWDFCQIQYNYLDVNYQAGVKGLRLAAQKGLGVIVMEPLLGGKLAINPQPPAVQSALDVSKRGWAPAEWALQWIWDQPEVSLLLSGMSNMEQVEQNIAAASRSGANTFNAEDKAVIEAAQQAYKCLMPIPCTHCEYCLPCPQGVSIPDIFEMYNTGKAYDKMDRAVFTYNRHILPENKANQCVECGQCESLCPQHIEIIDWLKKVHAELYEETK